MACQALSAAQLGCISFCAVSLLAQLLQPAVGVLHCSYVVCPSCHAVEPLDGAVMQTMKACQPVICNTCQQDEMRFKV